MKNTDQDRFGKISFPDTEIEIKNCWLRVRVDKIYLEVPAHNIDDKYFDVLLGSFNGLNNVTFIRCRLGGGQDGRGGLFKRIYPLYMFENICCKKINDLIFSDLAFASKSLDNWVVSNKVQLNFEEFEKSRNLGIPDYVELHRANLSNFEISIFRGFALSSDSENFEIERRTIFQLKFAKKTHFDDISKIILQAKRLILFLTHESPNIENYSLWLDNQRPAQLNENSRFNRLFGFSECIQVGYTSIEPFFNTFLKNWFEKTNIHQVVELIQECYMNTALSFQNYFLNCCVAIESFYDRTVSKGSHFNNSNILNRTEMRKAISELIQDSEIKNKFNLFTTDWKRATFKEKLEHFKGTVESVKPSSINESYDDIIKKIVGARNKLAHDGDYTKHMTEFELFLFGKVLEFSIKIEVLKYLAAFDQTTIKLLCEDAKTRIETLATVNRY